MKSNARSKAKKALTLNLRTDHRKGLMDFTRARLILHSFWVTRLPKVHLS